jgi:hypothetical protein
MDDNDFMIHAEGRLVSKGVFEIDARLRVRDGIELTPGYGKLGAARNALLQAVVDEAARGRTQGATEFLVKLDDLGKTYEIDFDELVGANDRPH